MSASSTINVQHHCRADTERKLTSPGGGQKKDKDKKNRQRGRVKTLTCVCRRGAPAFSEAPARSRLPPLIKVCTPSCCPTPARCTIHARLYAVGVVWREIEGKEGVGWAGSLVGRADEALTWNLRAHLSLASDSHVDPFLQHPQAPRPRLGRSRSCWQAPQAPRRSRSRRWPAPPQVRLSHFQLIIFS